MGACKEVYIFAHISLSIYSCSFLHIIEYNINIIMAHFSWREP